MKTNWDYTDLAKSYVERPNYARAALESVMAVTTSAATNSVCDVGAGAAHLTLMLAEQSFNIVAVEPNDAMRTIGTERTKYLNNVSWKEGTGEKTGLMSDSFDLVTFGSSFNVCNRALALKETARILNDRGWFACLWNHRTLEDPIQAEIEKIINKAVPEYNYGTRREDQEEVINNSGLFGQVVKINAGTDHKLSVEKCVEAWRSHGTLARQAGDRFNSIINLIEKFLTGLRQDVIQIPYTTKIWVAQKR